MGQRKSKVQKEIKEKDPSERTKELLDIPPESPLGWMLRNWEKCPERKRKSKAKMIYYCAEVWGGQELRNYLIWPVLGTFEKWTCNELISHVERKASSDSEEKEYARLWLAPKVGLFPVKQKNEIKTESWEPLDHLPPPYNGPAGLPAADQVVPSAPTGSPEQPAGGHTPQIRETAPVTAPAAPPMSPPTETTATTALSGARGMQGWKTPYPPLPVQPPLPGPSKTTESTPFDKELRKRGLIPQSVTLGFPIHKIQPGDKVLIKVWKELPLGPHWEGPYLVLLTTDTAVRTAEKGWTHHSRAKKVPDCSATEWKVTTPPGELKIKLRRHRK
ncbi:uncharacterized protein LOC111943813 [Cyanistes caeruleus]|uniref:uncharacterized protein LOC111943813 n=1 Tax=Cyanistes caeruleus TaxID=156563 RepID=UPI000CDA8FA1|nr:uncharacterized protein LOC111943813 [Cyanistes caeruleus]